MKTPHLPAVLAASALALLVGACGAPARSPSPPPPEGSGEGAGAGAGKDEVAVSLGQGCSEEAQICPDGSRVARAGDRCEFPKCPDWPAVEAPSGPWLGPTGGKPPGGGCEDLCGNGTCEEVVCMAVGCPCAETKASCPKDCK